MKQEQFLDVVDEATAHARFEAACAHLARNSERVALADALGRVLAEDVTSPVDVPGFDRSNVDGFAVRAADTFGAEELAPVELGLSDVEIAAGGPAPADFSLPAGKAALIATGGALPRGADAVVMVEHTTPGSDGCVRIEHAVVPGRFVTWAGTDVGRGDVVARRGEQLSSHETGLLAAVGVAEVPVIARPRVALLSTGDEVRAPGSRLETGQVYDSNQRVLADAVIELGGDAVECGIVRDDESALRERLLDLVRDADVVLLSGGTSKGRGDLNYRVVEQLAEELPDSPGVLVHGVALKPGKPICLAVVGGTPVVVLPGFPTSAVFTFHEFVSPLVRRLAGTVEGPRSHVDAVLPVRVQSVVGRTQYVLVHLIDGADGGADGRAAYPLGAGSGSVSAFARADGFLRIPHDEEYVEAGTRVSIRRLGRTRVTDLVAIGSHCVGLDRLLGVLAASGVRSKSIAVGSQGGLDALARGEGDVAGVHLLDPETGEYNAPFLPPGVVTIGGYGRRQGVVFRSDDERFDASLAPAAAVAAATSAGARMVNRNAGSGTRVLIDALLADAGVDAPDGHHTHAKTHNAVAAAVAQGRADWGVTLDVLASAQGLAFLPLREERYDVVAREDRLDRRAVQDLRDLLAHEDAHNLLESLGFVVG